jgi:hypothetical protein
LDRQFFFGYNHTVGNFRSADFKHGYFFRHTVFERFNADYVDFRQFNTNFVGFNRQFNAVFDE